MRPNAALGASHATNATLGASDAPNATSGSSPERGVRWVRGNGVCQGAAENRPTSRRAVPLAEVSGRGEATQSGRCCASAGPKPMHPSD
ncbi:hypothetical protein DMP23_11490 [Amycolatopsis sp. A1MSW2902]